MTIAYEEFDKVDLRSGTVLKVELFPKQTAAQVTVHYTPESLIGRQVMGCVNFPPRNIAGFISEFLLVGFPDENGAVCLASCDPKVPNGKKLF